jgi:hypothetical protein
MSGCKQSQLSSLSETHRVRALPAQHHYRYSVPPVVPVALLHIDSTVSSRSLNDSVRSQGTCEDFGHRAHVKIYDIYMIQKKGLSLTFEGAATSV